MARLDQASSNVAGPERARLVTADGLVIEAECAAMPAKGATAWFAIRPEKVRLARATETPASEAAADEPAVANSVARMANARSIQFT